MWLDRGAQVMNILERALEWLIAALMLGLVAIVASQLVDRHIVTLPIAAPDQYARVLLVWLTFIGFAVAVKNGTNIRVDLIDAHLPVFLRRSLEVFFDVLMLLLIVLITYYALPLLDVGLEQERLGTVLTEAWPTAALLASGVLLVAFLSLRLLLCLAGRPVPRTAHLD